MFPSHLSSYVINARQSVADAYWKLHEHGYGLETKIVVVLDDEDRFLGVMTEGDFANRFVSGDTMVGQYCKKGTKVCAFSEGSLKDALLIFANHPNIDAIPVIDDSHNLKDIIFREQAFYPDCYRSRRLPRMHYARQIFESAMMAKRLNYPSVSVIEFGVAGGNGLVNCEFHAKEISRLLGIKIEVYGFDSGAGMPHSDNYKDPLFLWNEGDFPMDIEKLQKRLSFSKLVIGDFRETCGDFLKKGGFSPIGAMLIDVDYYTSTVPILKMLLGDSKNFLPRVYMYFDDLINYLEFNGEMCAIDEFNADNHEVKISKFLFDDSGWLGSERNMRLPRQRFQLNEDLRLYCAHLFKHERYNHRILHSTKSFLDLR